MGSPRLKAEGCKVLGMFCWDKNVNVISLGGLLLWVCFDVFCFSKGSIRELCFFVFSVFGLFEDFEGSGVLFFFLAEDSITVLELPLQLVCSHCFC